MKKLYALIIFLGLAAYVSGQTYLSEDFSSGQMPPVGWTIDNLAGQWAIDGGDAAGGAAPEGKFNYIDLTAVTRLISPEIDLTGLTTIKLMFSHYYDDYTGSGPKLGVATRHDGGAWTTVWEIDPSTNVGPENKIFDIANADVGSSTFQFCFYLDGYLYNIDYWYVDDIYLFIPFGLDARLGSANLISYGLPGATSDLTGRIKNLGTDPITSFDINYTVNGGSDNLYSVTGVNIPLGENYDFTHDIPLLFPDAGAYKVVTNIQNVNGTNDMDPSNDTVTSYVSIAPYHLSKKVFAEEATGTWCGWCVRGICYMDYMAETYPDTWIAVAVHNGDPMVNTDYDNAIPNIIPNFPGYPSGTIDRAGDNYWDPEQFEQGYQERLNAVSPANIRVVNFGYNPGTRVVWFDVESDFIVDVYHELRFAAVISEDSCWGTTTDWDQANYYEGGGQGPMCGFELLPDPIPAADMHYDHVARVILDSPYGTEGSLPSPLLAGNTYSHYYTYTLPAEWDYNKLHFIGLLMDNITGEILNSEDVVIWTGINDQNREISFGVYPNPMETVGNVKFILKEQAGVELRVHDLLGRIVYSEPVKQYPAGEHKIVLNAGSLENGVYIVELNVGNKSYTQKVSVIK